jgi:uncharacterized protein YidB (DUF937 family)
MGLLDQVIGSVLGSRMGSGVGGGSGGGMLGSGNRGGTSPLMMALMALLAAKGMGGRSDGLLGGGGGLGGLGGLLGGSRDGTGMGGGLLGGGLGGLLSAFQQSGHADIAQSWVNHGENRPVAPNQLMDVLGIDTIDRLEQQTGMPREQLLAELSETLPPVVDRLTPDGRLPNDDEMNHW